MHVNRTTSSRRLGLLCLALAGGALSIAVANAANLRADAGEPPMQSEPVPSESMQADSVRDASVIASIETRPPTAEQIKFFEEEIRPVLIRECYGCHSKNARLAKSGLRVDTRDAIRRGGKSGPAVVPNDLDSSLLIRAVRYDDVDLQMPPDGKLPAAEIRALEKWVAMGAPDPREERAEEPDDKQASPGTAHRWSDKDIAEGKTTHWAYRPIARPDVPKVANADWSHDAIDALLFAKLAEKDLSPAAPADRRTLIRRASLDLTGLPPSEAEIRAFEADPSKDAFAHVVDRLLASPQFGERWGRHWLDVARYAESSGKESNIFYPHAWRYRDYVIAAFNSDKPFDRFLTEQLAGDLLPAKNDAERAELAIATGYLAVGTKSHNARGKPQFQMDLADEQLDATTQGMLGLTVACARCHDHKFDPITQKDYYAVAGIFLSTDTRYGTFDAQGNNHPAELIALPKDAGVSPGPTMPPQMRSLIATAAERAQAEAKKSAELIEQARQARLKGQDLPANLQQQVVRARAAAGISRNTESLVSRYDERGEPTDANLVAMGAADRRQMLNARVLDRGELDKAGDVVHRGFVKLVSQGDEPTIAKGSGRLELAQWITDKDNPLTARVWANRVWLHLFGNGIVPTPDNFGMSGQKPTNPALLDHLATRLIADGWSTKKLIREIMLSRAYQMSSAFNAQNAERDPDDAYFWRMPKKRLEAEAIRDSMLLAAGTLDLHPRTGSPVAFTEGGARGAAQDRIMTNIVQAPDNHRSVYLPIVRDKIPEALDVFDFAETAYVTGQRDTTNVPTQALFLMNSDEIARAADAFAKRVLDATDGKDEKSNAKDVDRINAAFALAFGRKPAPSEVIACREFLADFSKAVAHDGGAKASAAQKDAKAKDARQVRREAVAQRIRDRVRGAGNTPNTPKSDAPNSELRAYSALCQALFLSGEFRTVD